MKLPELFKIDKFIKVPQIFHSDSTNKPFSFCIGCEKYLLEDGIQYVIEKAIKNYKDYNTNDTIFEYAMCLDCYEKIEQSFSKISKKNIEHYFNKNVDIIKRHTELLKDDSLNIDKWISNCIVKGTSIAELSEYQIVCLCDGTHLLFTFSPFMISSEAIDEIAELLSDKTLGEIERFMDDFFDYPPEFRDILKDRPVLIF